MSDDTVVKMGVDVVGAGIRIPVEQVLSGAKNKLDQVVVVGIQTDGELWISSSENEYVAVFLLEKAKQWLVRDDD